MTHEVGKKKANRYGFYDLIGNVFEYIWDWSSDSVSVWGGGFSKRSYCGDYLIGWLQGGTTFSSPDSHDYRHKDVGFRIVCPVE